MKIVLILVCEFINGVCVVWFFGIWVGFIEVYFGFIVFFSMFRKVYIFVFIFFIYIGCFIMVWIGGVFINFEFVVFFGKFRII